MFAISLMFSLNVFSANEVVRVGQVADAVSLTGNVDYMIFFIFGYTTKLWISVPYNSHFA